MPRDRHAELFRRIHRWLTPGGWLLVSPTALNKPDGVEANWLGRPMFFIGYDATTNDGLLCGAGFGLVMVDIVTMQEPEGKAMFQWVLASRDGP